MKGSSTGAHHRPKQRNIALRAFLITLALAILLAGLLVGVNRLEQAKTREETEQRGVLDDNEGQLKRIEYNGQTYVHKPEITTVLMMGIDRDSDVETKGYRSGGQADFLLLLVIDHSEKVIHRLSIDRDTAAQITGLSVFGKPMGTFRNHIALAHGFGSTDEERCGYTVTAVETLLHNEKVDLYFSVNMDKIGLVNDMVGGVTVTVDVDMTGVDPAFTEGAVIKLQGEQAYSYVRARMTVGDGTNRSRMERQRRFLEELVNRLRDRVRVDSDFIGKLYDTLGNGLCTNMSRGRMINEANRAWNYAVEEIEQLDGVYQKDVYGYTEFAADENSITKWVLKTYYEPET